MHQEMLQLDVAATDHDGRNALFYWYILYHFFFTKLAKGKSEIFTGRVDSFSPIIYCQSYIQDLRRSLLWKRIFRNRIPNFAIEFCLMSMENKKSKTNRI